MKKVVKFGGSSLASAKQFKKVGDIIRSDKSRRYVIPSAPGKRNDKDEKVTDMLYQCYEAASTGGAYKKILEKIKSRYEEIIDGLELNLNLTHEFETIEENFVNKAGRDYAASRGEYLNGLVMAEYLGFEFVDAADVVFFHEDGSFDAEATNRELGERLESVERAVIPGFYGATADGTVKTFSRGGSDVTGSLVAKAIHADMYENWTDVSGFLTADPRVVENPREIRSITYKELRELSYMGASVLHEDAMFPVHKAGIPTNIRNTNDPSHPGTIISLNAPHDDLHPTITGIAGRKGFSVISIEKAMMNSELGFGRKVLQAFEENCVSFEHLPTGIDTLCVVVSGEVFAPKRDIILSRIVHETNPDTITVYDNMSIIATVGRGMVHNCGTAARLFAAMSKAGINVRMIDQGSSELSIIVGVNDADYESTIQAIYNAFVK